jgi:hypothetical protein
MKNNIVRDIFFGMALTILLMLIITVIVAKVYYPYVFDNFRGINKIYITLLGYGFFGNVVLYSLFWYLQKEYIQRGILIITVITSLIFIINRFA